MSNIIDFAIERAYRKSGIQDRALLEDILTQGYNPCNPDDLTQYYKWNGFLNSVQTADLPDADYWTEESLSEIWRTMHETNTMQTYTISYDLDELWNSDDEIIINLDSEFDDNNNSR